MFLPGYTDPGTTTQLVQTQQADGSFVLTSNQSETEQQLSRRVLTPSEFASAFTRYKEVICERFPDRARELDSYHISCTFWVWLQVKAYWQYQTLFSSKAAGLWARGYKVNFSTVDPTLLNASIAYERANVCANCQQPLYATAACPFNLQKRSNPGFSKGGKEGNSKFFPTSQPSQANPVARTCHKGVEVCDNFNHQECKLRKCNYEHVCKFCQSDEHPIKDCKKYKCFLKP